MTEEAGKTSFLDILKNVVLSFLSSFDTPLEKIIWNIFILAGFSALYYFIVKVSEGDKERKLTIEEAIYFTFTVHFTVGFGDFSPSNKLGKFIFMFHVFMVWMINMVPVGLLATKSNKISPITTAQPTTVKPTSDNLPNEASLLNEVLKNTIHKNSKRNNLLVN